MLKLRLRINEINACIATPSLAKEVGMPNPGNKMEHTSFVVPKFKFSGDLK